MNQAILTKIHQRRLQILVHSYIYYELNDNIVSDSKWAQWAKELVDLQANYPQESCAEIYFEQFKNFDGSTGAFFVYNSNIINTALHLLTYHKNKSPIKVKSNKKSNVIKKTKRRSLI